MRWVWLSNTSRFNCVLTCGHWEEPLSVIITRLCLLHGTMANMKQLRFSTVVATLTFLLGIACAQRPTNASVCDYYATARYGANSSDTQLKFIQNVVCLAFEGGTKLNNVSSDITGILRKGKFNSMDIDLLQYFNGSRASTNVNNAPIGINWLDQGGTTPLAAFLAGESQTLNLADTSNQ